MRPFAVKNRQIVKEHGPKAQNTFYLRLIYGFGNRTTRSKPKEDAATA